MLGEILPVVPGSVYVKWLPESHRDGGGWPRAGEEDGGGFNTP